jgi:hypothetical protein
LTVPHALKPAVGGQSVCTDIGWSGRNAQGEVLAVGPAGIEAAVVAPALTTPNPGPQLTAARLPAPYWSAPR